MNPDRRTTWPAWINSRVAVVSAMLVLLAIITLPGCPRLPSAFAIGQDVRTVTENRGIVETFSSPGHFRLHAIGNTSVVCEACDDGNPADADQQAAAPVVTIDVTARDLDQVREPRLGEVADPHRTGSPVLPAGHIARVPAPPPRSF